MKLMAHHPTDLIKTKQAAHLLGVTVQTIKNYIYSGKLKSYKTLGGHHRLSLSDLQGLTSYHSSPSRKELVEQYDHLYRSYLDTIGALLNALDARDGIASGHSRRVANYACAIGKAMGFSPQSQRTLELAAFVLMAWDIPTACPGRTYPWRRGSSSSPRPSTPSDPTGHTIRAGISKRPLRRCKEVPELNSTPTFYGPSAKMWEKNLSTAWDHRKKLSTIRTHREPMRLEVFPYESENLCKS